MKCPKCKSKKLRVSHTDPEGKNIYENTIIRYRQCRSCGHRFKTFETYAETTHKLTDPVTNPLP
jgi:transcriptional regulator NrdR family protein